MLYSAPIKFEIFRSKVFNLRMLYWWYCCICDIDDNIKILNKIIDVNVFTKAPNWCWPHHGVTLRTEKNHTGQMIPQKPILQKYSKWNILWKPLTLLPASSGESLVILNFFSDHSPGGIDYFNIVSYISNMVGQKCDFCTLRNLSGSKPSILTWI